ncbi:MAG: lipocalin family protein [Flavobacteriaceae bacterium]
MRKFSFFLIMLIMASCADSLTLEDLKHLNGYWEIEKVILADGNIKNYEISTIIDYFEYKDLKGFRKKVQPNLNGSYTTSDDAVFFEILAENKKFIIHYHNDINQWEEEIKHISSQEMIIVNLEGVYYYYKRFEGILP